MEAFVIFRRMALFNFFSKEKKETLDKGLEKTKQSFFSKLTRTVVGKSRVDSEVLDNLEEVLISSDVLFGIIPMGSGNGLSRFLNIPMNCKKAIQIIKKGRCKTWSFLWTYLWMVSC